ncbi:MAG: DUF2207 domain-containing protein [Vicinamibacterales bacterium]
MRRSLLSIAIVVLLAPTLVSADEGWVIERLDFRLAIQPSGSIEAAEALDVDFRGLARHGIFRDIVSLLGYDGTSNRRYDINLGGVTDTNQRPHQAQTTTEGSITRLRIGDPDRTISGKQTYRIAYRLDGALNAFADHDELYWNATGVWPVRVERAVVRVTAPVGAIERADCFQGRPGSTERCEAQLTPDEATFTATRTLAEGEQMTIVAGLRKGAVAQPMPLLIARPRRVVAPPLDILHVLFDRTPVFVALTLAGFAAAFGGVGLLWWTFGRDRRYASIHYLSQNLQEQRVPLFGSDPVVVEFEPPKGMRPGQMGLLFDESADTLDVTATIVDLAVRGYLTITELPRSNLRAWLGTTDYQLDRLKEADAGLLEYERIVLNGLFDSGSASRRKLSDLKENFYADLLKAKKALIADAVERGWFPRDPNAVRTAWHVVAVAVALAGVALTIYLGFRWGAGLVGLPVVAAGTLLLVVADAMPRRTAKGREATRRALGFARYINTAERHQQAFAERANLFTSYLPYAIAMKCIDRWAQAFKDIDARPETAGWYVGSSRFDAGSFDAGSFSSNIASFSSSISFAMAVARPADSTPGGSGESGFSDSGSSGSGGSSGGGGGGGGGGSW